MRRVYNTRVAFVVTSLIILSCFWVSDSVCRAGTGDQDLAFGTSEWCLPEGETKFPQEYRGLLNQAYKSLPEWLRFPSAFQCIAFLEVDQSHRVGSYVRGSAILFTSRWPKIWDSLPRHRVLEEMRTTLSHELGHMLLRDLERERRDAIFPVVVAAESFTDLFPTRWLPLHLGGQKGIVFRRQNGRESDSILQDQSGRRLVRDRTGFRDGPEAVANNMS